MAKAGSSPNALGVRIQALVNWASVLAQEASRPAIANLSKSMMASTKLGNSSALTLNRVRLEE